MVPLLDRPALRWYTRYGIRGSNLRVRAARRRRAVALLERDERHRVPVPDRLVGAEGIANRGNFDLRSTPSSRARSSSTSTSDGERYVPHVIEPAGGVDRALLAFLVDAYDEEVVADASARCSGCTRAWRR